MHFFPVLDGSTVEGLSSVEVDKKMKAFCSQRNREVSADFREIEIVELDDEKSCNFGIREVLINLLLVGLGYLFCFDHVGRAIFSHKNYNKYKDIPITIMFDNCSK